MHTSSDSTSEAAVMMIPSSFPYPVLVLRGSLIKVVSCESGTEIRSLSSCNLLNKTTTNTAIEML